MVELFLNLIEEVEADIEELREQKASTHDIALLIQEMRSGFALMEKRFDSVDKRFEDMNKRFTSMQWLMGIGLSMLALLITLLTYLTKQA
ncbi:MAG: hypothetical protein SVZ03_09495 [Spirochaetota bacterium]|nr:hypothetical protein [Spirochaetota bacterium]